MTRMVVLIDYENVRRTARDRFRDPPTRGHVDIVALSEMIAARSGGALSEIRVYRGTPNPRRQPVAAAANSRQCDVWSRDRRVVLRRRPLRYLPTADGFSAAEKGVDVLLGADLVRIAAEGLHELAVVVSRDTDLVPALEVARDLSKDLVVATAMWAGCSRLRYPRDAAPLPCHVLSAADFRCVEDRTDYTRGNPGASPPGYPAEP